MKKKNSYIELLRFLMCIVILIHHSGFVQDEDIVMMFPFGALAADFFFMVTGYFAYAHLLGKEKSEVAGTNTMKYWMNYTVGKLKRVLPFAAVGIVSIYALEFFWPREADPIIDRVLRLQNMPFELTLSPMLGVIPMTLYDLRNAPLWFLSAMFVALPLLMYLVSKYRDVFMHYVIWFLPPIAFCWMVTNYDGVCPWAQYSGIIYCGVIRAFADMMMGVSIYVAARALEKKLGEADITVKFPVTVCELALLALIGYEMHRMLAPYDQILVLYLIAIMLVIAFSGASLTSMINSRFINYLGKLSMPIYCMHWGVYQYVAKFLRRSLGYWGSVGVTFAICVVLSVLLMLIIDAVAKNIAAKKMA